MRLALGLYAPGVSGIEELATASGDERGALLGMGCRVAAQLAETTVAEPGFAERAAAR